jgi:hypothetical protein
MSVSTAIKSPAVAKRFAQARHAILPTRQQHGAEIVARGHCAQAQNLPVGEQAQCPPYGLMPIAPYAAPPSSSVSATGSVPVAACSVFVPGMRLRSLTSLAMLSAAILPYSGL